MSTNGKETLDVIVFFERSLVHESTQHACTQLCTAQGFQAICTFLKEPPPPKLTNHLVKTCRYHCLYLVLTCKIAKWKKITWIMVEIIRLPPKKSCVFEGKNDLTIYLYIFCWYYIRFYHTIFYPTVLCYTILYYTLPYFTILYPRISGEHNK